MMLKSRCARAIARASTMMLLGYGAAFAQASAAAVASAPTPARVASDTLDEVVVTGSREPGVTAANSAAPVQIVGAPALRTAAGNPTLMSALALTVPSFTLQAFGNDMAGQTLQARLRGLSCNDVLVLVNGKRRHTTANIELDSGPFQGCNGVDLNFIPLDAIERVEVLTDGAAAQYGSDAIAGVINIILKKNSSGALISGTYGGYLDGGGITGDVSAHAGFEPIEHGYLDISAEAHHHGSSNRSAIDERVVNPSNLARYPDSNMPEVAGYPYLGAEEGDGNYDLKTFALNAGVPIHQVELYAFATYGVKDAQSFQKYRLPDTVQYTDPTTGATTYPFPFGFVPLEASRETDGSATAGLKGAIDHWRWDLGSTYGRDQFNVYTLNSANSGVDHPTPRNYYDGYLRTTQWTSNLDANRDFDVGLAGPLNVAWGVEYRRGRYGIGAGIPISYLDGGAQSYPGYTPTDAGTHSRDVEAAYVDLAAQPIEALRIDLAGRYEHFTDFGSTTVGKLTARYDFTPALAVRGTVSSGFRAPTLAEEYYSSTNVTPTSAFVQLPPNSAGGRLIGLGNGLKPEHSVNLSVGLVWRPTPGVIGTLDLYHIDITNRIVATGSLYGELNGTQPPGVPRSTTDIINAAIAANGNQLDPAVLKTGTTGVTLFANGIDTSTEGADLLLEIPQIYAFGHVDWSVGGTFNRTFVTKVPTAPASLKGETLYDATAISNLTEASPRYVINVGAVWTREKLRVHLEEQLYGKSSQWESDDGDNPTKSPEYFRTTIGVTPITDLDVAYHLTRHVTFSAGAVNLFNRYPNRYNATLLAHYDNFKYGDTLGVFQYPMFSPFGINGGYYYVRGTLRF